MVVSGFVSGFVCTRCFTFNVETDARLEMCDSCVWGELQLTRQHRDEARECARHMLESYRAIRTPSHTTMETIIRWEDAK